MKTHFVADLSHLEHTGFDSRVVTWWGTLALMALEGMGFLLCYGIFLYVAWLNPQWPLGYPPQPMFWTNVFTFVIVASLVPNYIVMRTTKRKSNRSLRWLLVLMSLTGLGLLAVRWFEFDALTLRWDDNAYGSMLWAFLGLHTLHLATDVVDTIVMTALFFTGHVPEKRFTDADENALYWVLWSPDGYLSTDFSIGHRAWEVGNAAMGTERLVGLGRRVGRLHRLGNEHAAQLFPCPVGVRKRHASHAMGRVCTCRRRNRRRSSFTPKLPASWAAA